MLMVHPPKIPFKSPPILNNNKKKFFFPLETLMRLMCLLLPQSSVATLIPNPRLAKGEMAFK